MENSREKLSVLTDERFRIFFKILRIGGFPVYMDRVPYYQTIYNISLDICLYFSFFGIVMEFVVNIDDLQQAMKSLRIVVSTILCIWLQLNIRLFSRKIDQLIHLTEIFVWEDLPPRDVETRSLTKAGWIPYIQIIARNAIVFTSIFHLTQSVLRMIISGELIFKSSYPFDVFFSPVYEIVYVIQVFATLQCECAYMGWLMGYAIFAFVACSQLDKIQDNLSKIKQETDKPINVSVVNSNCDEEQHILTLVVQKSCMQKLLNDCIQHHKKIIEFIRAIEDVMNVPVCGIFMISLIAMCFSVFSVITSWGDYVDIGQAVYMYLMLVAIVSVFCNLGSELKERMETVKEAAWSCDWVGTPIPFQRCLIFIIAMANNGFTLTAGKFVPISKTTLLNMLNQSMSFFMFLLAMKDKNGESKENI